MIKSTTIPHLTTALTGHLGKLESTLLAEKDRIESWFAKQWDITPPPLYCSVDLRNAGFKIAPIDTNLFPAGFNNLNPDFMPLCQRAMQETLSQLAPGGKKVLLLPETHTRNAYYADSLQALLNIITHAGFEVRIGWSDDNPPTELSTTDGQRLPIYPLLQENNRLKLMAFNPDVIVLNNDLSSGMPVLCQDITQPIFPAATLGWTSRLKSTHFSRYQAIAHALSELLDIDAWLMTPLFKNCGDIDFMSRAGSDCLVKNAGLLLKAIQAKYDAYGIKKRPFVMVKADAGTYGMGVMPIFDVQTLRTLNRKQRTHMSAAKGGRAVNTVIIQEGIYSVESSPNQNGVAEPVIYMIGRHVVGGFYRVHPEREAHENLNTPGMLFNPLAFANPQENNRFYAYSVIARLALLAAAKEMEMQ